MAKYKLAPTKSNLLKTKRNFSFAAEGHSLLEEKREILIAELLNLKERAKKAESDLDEALSSAYKKLKEAIVICGRKSLSELAPAANLKYKVSISSHKVMGVDLPRVSISSEGQLPFYFPYSFSSAPDAAIVKFKESIQVLAIYAQYRVSILRLAREVKKTVRRVNALEKIYLPDYTETITYIESFLQEQERESFFIQKMIKKKIEEERKNAE